MSAVTQKAEPDRPNGPHTDLCRPGPLKVLRSAASLGLIALALTAQVGSARAEGSLVDLFSQLFAPGPQPSYAPSLRASQPRHTARLRRTEPVLVPQRGAIVRVPHSERVRAARS